MPPNPTAKPARLIRVHAWGRQAGIARAYNGGPAQRKGPPRGLRAALTRLEDKFLPAEGEGFLCGAEPCIADLSVAPPLMLLGVAGLPLSEPVQAYVARCEAFFGEKYGAPPSPLAS